MHPESINVLTSIRQRLAYARLTVSSRIPVIQPKAIRDIRGIFRGTALNPIASPEQSKHILIFASRQARGHLAWHSTIGQALVARGHKVTVLGCDRFSQSSCNSGHFPGLTNITCKSCFAYAAQHAKASGLETRWLGDYSEPEDGLSTIGEVDSSSAEEIGEIVIDGLPVGEISKASVTHYMKTGAWFEDQATRDAHADFVKGASRLVPAIKRLLTDIKPDAILMLNGWFMPERIVLEYSKRLDINVTTYESGYQSGTLFFESNDVVTYDAHDRWDKVKDFPLSGSQLDVIETLLEKRRHGSGLGLNTERNVDTDWKQILSSAGLKEDVPTAVLFTNVTWDSTLWAGNIAFKGIFEWIASTINYFRDNPSSQLLIRVHPAEMLTFVGTRYPMIDYIRDNFTELPPNIAVIPPDSTVNSYSLVDNSNVVLVYSSTLGVEAAAFGKHVLLAGGVHYRGKGFTLDVETETEFHAALSNALRNKFETEHSGLDDLAKRYLYHLFYRISIPFKFVHQNGLGTRPEIRYRNASELMPGNDPNLDIICDAIVSGYAPMAADYPGGTQG